MSYKDTPEYKEYEAARARAKEREQRFIDEWPEWFTNVPCGFYLPEEWESLVWTMCEYINWQMEHEKIPLSALEVAQVKEKFWGLRFYYSLNIESSEQNDRLKAKIQGVVELTENLSMVGPYELPQRIAGKQARANRSKVTP